MFNKHFVKQWRGESLIHLTIVSAPEVSKSFSRWSINFAIENKTIKSEVHNADAQLPSLMSHVTNNMSLVNIRNKHLHATF